MKKNNKEINKKLVNLFCTTIKKILRLPFTVMFKPRAKNKNKPEVLVRVKYRELLALYLPIHVLRSQIFCKPKNAFFYLTTLHIHFLREVLVSNVGGKVVAQACNLFIQDQRSRISFGTRCNGHSRMIMSYGLI